MEIKDLFSSPRVIAVIGDTNEAKSNFLYHIIETLKKEHRFNLYTFGLKSEIKDAKVIYSVEELEQIKDSVIILDELMSMWDLDDRKAKKLIENSLRLLFHNNNVLIISALPENIKKFIAGKITQIFFKKCTIADFINGSKTKNIVLSYKGTELGSSVLSIGKGEALFFDGKHYEKIDVPYYKRHDSKKDNVEIIIEKEDTTVKEIVEDRDGSNKTK